MKWRNWMVVFCMLVCCQAVQAQGKWRLPVLAKKIEQSLNKNLRRAVQVGVRTQAPVQAYAAKNVQANINRALVQVVDRGDGLFHTSGFVFEEFLTGKRTVWAALPYHSAGRAGREVYLRFFDANGQSFVKRFKVTQSGSGGINGLDVSLVKLSPEEAVGLFALRLAPFKPQVGQLAYGYGFTYMLRNEAGYESYPRAITDVTGFKITGDFNLPFDPSGFCGSPIVEKGGYVLGMHCGSEKGRRSFAVSAEGINKLLRAFYFKENSLPVKYCGKTLAEITPSQRIGRIVLKRGGKIIKQVNVFDFTGPFSYQQTERVFRPGEVQKQDELQFEIIENGETVRRISYTEQ